MKSIEVISLIYNSVDYLKMIISELQSDNCKVDGWNVHIRIVANDANEKVLEYLKNSSVPYTIYNDPEPDAFYLNRVYRCWNHAAQTSQYDTICFVNSDMVFSKNWLANLLKHHDGINIPCSRLVESGRLRSGLYGIEQDFGRHPKDINRKAFNEFAQKQSEDIVKANGLYMPCVFEKSRFIEAGMYPEGNMFKEGVDLVCGYPNDRPVFMSGDRFFFNDLQSDYGMKHITVFDSMVYHIQEGEMRS